MDPISLAIGAVGLGMQIFGGIGSSETSEKMSQVSADEAHQEQGINDQKQQAMELDARRQQLEIMRRGQQAQALAQSRATNQGAQFGSGLQGGLAEVTDQSAFNLQGINNSLTIGRNINEYNSKISNDKVQMASLGADAATYAGWSSLGGSVMKAGPVLGQMGKGFGNLFGGSTGSSGTGFSTTGTGGLY